MKILLIDPPFYSFTGFADRWFSPGLASIGAVLRERGHEVAICQADQQNKHQDINFNSEYQQLAHYLRCLADPGHRAWGDLGAVIENFRPDLIGISALTMKFGSVVRVAELAKKWNSTVPVLIGGPHATSWPTLALAVPAIDYCLRGEAEESVLEFLDALNAGEPAGFKKVPGLCFRDGGRAILGAIPPPPRSLDHFPQVARDLLMFPEAYSSEDMGLLLTSRGCPYHCTFCAHERNVRYRSLDHVFAELRQVVDTYGTRQFAFKDDSFSVKRARTEEFCRRLRREGFQINWEITTRVNLVDEPLLDLMMQTGLNIMKVGVESGSPRILKQVEKTATMDQMRRVTTLFNRKNLFWSGYFMYGLPDETLADMKATLRFMRELNPMYAGLGLYAPMPDTPLWDQGVKMGLVIPDSEVTVDHFFTTNPKDYFLRDPRKRVRAVAPEKLQRFGAWMSRKFNHHNTRLSNLVRRALARRKVYTHDPSLFFADVRKGLAWAMPSWFDQAREKFLGRARPLSSPE